MTTLAQMSQSNDWDLETLAGKSDSVSPFVTPTALASRGHPTYVDSVQVSKCYLTLYDYPFDFILGSFHYIQDHDIGHRNGLEAFLAGKKIEEVLDTYYACWREAVESGLFYVMAHPDYFRKHLYTIHPDPVTFKEYGSSVLEAIDSL